MNENWHDVRQQLNKQLEIERKMAKIRRQQKWNERKLVIANKVEAVSNAMQLFLMRDVKEPG